MRARSHTSAVTGGSWSPDGTRLLTTIGPNALWPRLPCGRENASPQVSTGLRNLPFHDLAHNRIWVAITALAADLLTWTARLALPSPAATYEPKRLRLRILTVAARIVRTARRRILKIDPAWPWADTVTSAYAQLSALPAL